MSGTIQAIIYLMLNKGVAEMEEKYMVRRCPFCGGNEFYIDTVNPDCKVVVCLECNAVGPIAVSEGEAIEKWNKRPNIWRRKYLLYEKITCPVCLRQFKAEVGKTAKCAYCGAKLKMEK